MAWVVVNGTTPRGCFGPGVSFVVFSPRAAVAHLTVYVRTKCTCHWESSSLFRLTCIRYSLRTCYKKTGRRRTLFPVAFRARKNRSVPTSPNANSICLEFSVEHLLLSPEGSRNAAALSPPPLTTPPCLAPWSSRVVCRRLPVFQRVAQTPSVWGPFGLVTMGGRSGTVVWPQGLLAVPSMRPAYHPAVNDTSSGAVQWYSPRGQRGVMPSVWSKPVVFLRRTAGPPAVFWCTR